MGTPHSGLCKTSAVLLAGVSLLAPPVLAQSPATAAPRHADFTAVYSPLSVAPPAIADPVTLYLLVRRDREGWVAEAISLAPIPRPSRGHEVVRFRTAGTDIARGDRPVEVSAAYDMDVPRLNISGEYQCGGAGSRSAEREGRYTICTSAFSRGNAGRVAANLLLLGPFGAADVRAPDLEAIASIADATGTRPLIERAFMILADAAQTRASARQAAVDAVQQRITDAIGPAGINGMPASAHRRFVAAFYDAEPSLGQLAGDLAVELQGAAANEPAPEGRFALAAGRSVEFEDMLARFAETAQGRGAVPDQATIRQRLASMQRGLNCVTPDYPTRVFLPTNVGPNLPVMVSCQPGEAMFNARGPMPGSFRLTVDDSISVDLGTLLAEHGQGLHDRNLHVAFDNSGIVLGNASAGFITILAIAANAGEAVTSLRGERLLAPSTQYNQTLWDPPVSGSSRTRARVPINFDSHRDTGAGDRIGAVTTTLSVLYELDGQRYTLSGRAVVPVQFIP